MLFGLLKPSHFISLEDEMASVIPVGALAGLVADGSVSKAFAFESLITPVLLDTALDPLGAQSEIKELSFTCLLLDHSQYGNHQLWNAEVTKEEKLKKLHDLYEATYDYSKKKKNYALVCEPLNHLGIKLVQIIRLQNRIEETQIQVQVSLKVINEPQGLYNSKKGTHLSDGTKPAQIAKAAARQKTKSGAQVQQDEGFLSTTLAQFEALAKGILS